MVATDAAHVETLAEIVLRGYVGVLSHLPEPVLETFIKNPVTVVSGVLEPANHLDDSVLLIGDEPLVLDVGLGEVSRCRGLPFAG